MNNYISGYRQKITNYNQIYTNTSGSIKSKSGIEITGGSSPDGSTLIIYGIDFFFIVGLISLFELLLEGLLACIDVFFNRFDDESVITVDSGSNNSSVGDTDTSLIKSSNGESVAISYGAKISSIVELGLGLCNICETLLGLRTTPSSESPISLLETKSFLYNYIQFLH